MRTVTIEMTSGEITTLVKGYLYRYPRRPPYVPHDPTGRRISRGESARFENLAPRAYAFSFTVAVGSPPFALRAYYDGPGKVPCGAEQRYTTAHDDLYLFTVVG